MNQRLQNHIHAAHEMHDDNTLHVVGVISNFAQWHSRYRLFRQWLAEMKATPNVKVHVVELAHGKHRHELEAELAGESYLALRSPHGHLWLKEAMINAGVRYLLPKDWQYMCWCDTDVSWPDKTWAKQAIAALQRNVVIQPWATCNDLGPHGETNQHHESFAYVLMQRQKMTPHWSKEYRYAHTGYAWCCKRSFWENTGGLAGFALNGSGDHLMGWGIVGRGAEAVHGRMSDGFKRACADWARKAYRATNGHVGCVLTRVDHHYHGEKLNRFYKERWAIFVDAGYDPERDLAYDDYGLPYLVGKPALDEEIRRYNWSRKEDQSI